jgi:hypothetical protein
MAPSAETLAHPEQLSAMIAELRANRVVGDDLSIRCSMFRFTGGTIPDQAWSSSHMTSYLTAARSRAAGCMATEDVERYLALIGTIAELQLPAATAVRPRTLRSRRVIADALDQALCEVRLLGSHLELALRTTHGAAELLSAIH